VAPAPAPEHDVSVATYALPAGITSASAEGGTLLLGLAQGAIVRMSMPSGVGSGGDDANTTAFATVSARWTEAVASLSAEVAATWHKGDVLVRLWDAKAGVVLQTLRPSSRPTRCIIGLQVGDGRLVTLTGKQGTLKTWRVGRPTLLLKVKLGEPVALVAPVLGSEVAVARPTRITVMNMDTGVEVRHYPTFAGVPVTAVAGMSTGGVAFAVVHHVWVCARDDSKRVRLVHAAGSRVTCLAALRDGRLATGGSDGAAYVWDGDSGALVAVLEASGPPVVAMTELAGGRVAAGRKDGSVAVYTVTARAAMARKG
jgi:WD40 repeat protein